MKLDEFKIISKKLEKHANLIYLHKWGEPLMNKNIFDMIEISSKYAHTHISTNGMLIDEKKLKN